MMIDVPGIKLEDIEALADWVELVVLTSDEGVVSHTTIADVIHDAGLLGTADADFFPEDDEFESEIDDSSDDALFTWAEDVWSELRKREARLSSYPIEVIGDVAHRKNASWSESLSYLACILMACLTRYPADVTLERVANFGFRLLFEKVTESALKGLFEGATTRFGWPTDPGWSTKIEERVEQLGQRMALKAENLGEKVESKDKDLTLDVVSRLSLGDDGAASVIFVVQCATGRGWREKRAEPVLSMFQDLLLWKAALVRTVAVPFWLGNEKAYGRLFRWFSEAVILDRPRLLEGNPDARLEEPFREELEKWCREQITALPRVA